MYGSRVFGGSYLGGERSASADLIPRTITIKINDTDISSQVVWNSLQVTNNLYNDPDKASFEILNPDGKSYNPSVGDEIVIEDTGIKIFGGLLINKTKILNGYVDSYRLEFKDWIEELGNILVDNTYTLTNVEDIISDIFTDSDLSAYDASSNVSDTTEVTRIVFDNISVSEALDQLAELSGKHWYVSPTKGIFFFDDATYPAPFDLDDDCGRYFWKSLEIEEDYGQIRNKVIVKGRGIAAVTVEDATSQSTYGLREYFERDEEINATNEATQKANAILEAYKDSIKRLSFRTDERGLYAGQRITIQSDIRGINETVNIERVDFRPDGMERFNYEVTATTQRLFGIEELFEAQKNQPESPTVGDEDRSFLQDIEFTAIDDETIQWSSGTIRLSNGDTYSINSNASETLTGDHVIYFDKDASTTQLQISTNFADGIGSGKLPLAYATKSGVATKGADIFPIGFGGKIQLDGSVHITDKSIIADNIAANSITANEISANTITANELTTGEFVTDTANIADAIITNAKISDLSADKLTAGTIDASTITVNNLDADNITTGTLTGRTVRAVGSSGVDLRMNSSNGRLEFLYSGSVQSYMQSDSSGNLIIDGDEKIRLQSSGVNDDIEIDSGDDIDIFGETIFLKFDKDFFVEESDQMTFNYNSDATSDDCQWDSDFNRKMILNQDGDLETEGSITENAGIDFAERFESVEEYADKKIPNGTSVVLEGEKIRPAEKNEKPIGVVSATAGFVAGEGGISWVGKYDRDEFGEKKWEKADRWTLKGVRDKKGKRKKAIQKNGRRSDWCDRTPAPKGAKIVKKWRRKLNPDFDSEKEYIPRKDRPEWNVVGLLGKVRIRKGQPVAKNWIKLRDVTEKVEEWLIK